MSDGGVDNASTIIRSIPTSVPGLDQVLGGLPEYSFNLIAGGPGSGKTTLAQQIMFGLAGPERPGLYFTILGEPTLKMLRYQRQFRFFDPALVGTAIEFMNLSEEVLDSDPAGVLERIVREVERTGPGIVMVDSFRSMMRSQQPGNGMAFDQFVQQLALHLTSWEVTSFLIGEYDELEQPNPVFTVADGVLWLSQMRDRNSVVRKLQAVKVRGRAQMPGLHTFRITSNGVEVFPRIPEQHGQRAPQAPGRQSTGVPGLDEIMGGGIPAGDAVMIVGPSGSGKTTFCQHFVAAAGRRGESAVVAVFEEYPEEYLARAKAGELEDMAERGALRVIYLRPLDLSVDETLFEIMKAVEEIGAKRVVIDSLSGFEVALAPSFREDFRESLYRLVGALTAAGVTVLMTAEMVGGYPDVRFTSEKVSFITDDVIAQRYVEINGEVRKVLTVVKMRGSEHSRDFRTYDLTAAGAVVGGPLRDYQGIITGTPALRVRPYVGPVGLTERESGVLDTLIRLGPSPRETLVARSGLPSADIVDALERLVALGYVAAVDDAGDLFRAIAR